MKLAYNSDRKKSPTLYNFRNLTRDEILGLSGHCKVILRNGRVGEVKINGKVRTWKRDQDRVEVPIKYGMYEFHTVDLNEALEKFVVEENECNGTPCDCPARSVED